MFVQLNTSQKNMFTIAKDALSINPSPYLVKVNHWQPESTLKELSLYQCQIEWNRQGKDVDRQFHQNPLLPGIILMQEGQLMGMISRRRFLEHLSQPYGVELFLKRPIRSLYNFTKVDVLIYPSETTIVTAATNAVTRSPDMLLEPIIVELKPQVYRLVDVHQLLYAQAQIHRMTVRLLQDANDRLQRLATLDGLTQLVNRRQFNQYLEQEWQRLARVGEPLSMILCDIDYFKFYNDTYGHLAGDDCLQKVANALKEAICRPADLVARYGGEEFAVILPNSTESVAIAVAENIRAQLKQLQIPHAASQVSPWVTLSIGIATTIPSNKQVRAELIAWADGALYQAKAQGRDRIICCAESEYSTLGS